MSIKCWPSLTTIADHNEAGQQPTGADTGETESQASDGSRQRARTLQAEGQGFESPKLHSHKRAGSSVFSEIISEAVISASSCRVPAACPYTRTPEFGLGALADLICDDLVSVLGAVLVNQCGPRRRTIRSGSAAVKFSRCSITSGRRNAGMVTSRLPAVDLAGPVTSGPRASSTTLARTEMMPVSVSTQYRGRAASSPQRSDRRPRAGSAAGTGDR